MDNVQLAVQFFVQVAVILVICRVTGTLVSRWGQPQVVGEMIAGVLLGPTLFGVLAPEWQQALFPWDRTQSTRDTQSYLFPASQFGLALYMFIVGLEFRAEIVRDHLRSSLVISAAGMLAPFALGAGLALVFLRFTELFPPRTTGIEAMLFLGASMCITAFPMLARIIHFKGLAGTRLGTIALGAGAIDDATAWALLAVVLASFNRELGSAVLNITAGITYVVVTIGLIRPSLARLCRHVVDENGLTETGLVAGVALMALGAAWTDAIGLHAVFGAFVMGTAMPRGIVAEGLIGRLQPLTVAVLLPLFFTYSGLNTRIGLVDSLLLWLMCGAVLVAAVLGKGVACFIAGRMTSLPRREALGIAVLMNARGLMELIIINIGLQRGIISEALFAILVIMAVVTTLMACPIFDRLVNIETAPASSAPRYSPPGMEV